MRVQSLALGVLLLAVLVAADHSATAIVRSNSGAQQLTSGEMDCIVGGEAGCGTVVEATFAFCLIDAASAGKDLESDPSIGAGCALQAGFAGLICALEWLWGLFF